MTFITIVLALLLEQAHPVPVGRLSGWVAKWTRWLEDRFNAGEPQHGVAAWIVGVVLPSAVMLVAFVYAYYSNWLVAALLGVLVLYVTTGFRQFSHHFTDIQLALRAGELDQARRQLAAWRGRNTEKLTASEVARVAIEEALLAAHRHVFAPLFWFVALGPAGALLYRLAGHFCYSWGAEREPESELAAFGAFARRAFAAIDWLPVRLTAASFAVVGNFEDAVFCWRNQADRWPEEAGGILLSSGAGALGVRLGLPIDMGNGLTMRPELGIGDDADADFMQSAIGLAWRALVMALVLLLLLGIANWAG